MHRRKTKILATIGPASNSFEQLEKLYLAGVNAFRMNLSHGTHKDHELVIDHTQKLNEKYKSHISLLADLQGPKLRVGEIKDEMIHLKVDHLINVVTYPIIGDEDTISVTYDSLARDVKVGEMILIDDGKVSLEVVETNKTDKVVCRVVEGGDLSSKKGFNLPQTQVSMPSLTPKDREDLEFILQFPINWIALSFVRHADELIELRNILKEKGVQTQIMAKIEKPEAVKNINSIIDNSDAVMVARGDLAVEVPMEEMTLVQKKIIQKCIQKSKPVVLATQVMETMMTKSRPTRAEITDVSNAVLDGADVIMLSGETSVGDFPIKVVETIDKIINRVEKESIIYNKIHQAHHTSNNFYSDAICFKASEIASDIHAKCINVMTYSGYSALKISSCRPKAEINIFTSNKFLLNTLSIVWGTTCYYYNSFESTDETIEDVIIKLRGEKKVEKGDVIVNTGSMPIMGRGRTNMIKITVVE